MRTTELALEPKQSTERNYKMPLYPHISRKAKGNRNYKMTKQKLRGSRHNETRKNRRVT